MSGLVVGGRGAGSGWRSRRRGWGRKVKEVKAEGKGGAWAIFCYDESVW